MQNTESSPELAYAADVLSDQLRSHLQRLAAILASQADSLDEKFLKKLAGRKLDARVRSALVAITPGAAARILVRGLAPAVFIEQVEYNGRRLAKLNLPPTGIIEALQEYDSLLGPTAGALDAAEAANFHWVREQLQFCIVLTLNNAYYQVREAETQALYELFRGELEARNLDELLQKFLATLTKACRAEAAQLCLWGDGKGPARVLRVDGPQADEVERHAPLPAALRKQLARPQQMKPAAQKSELLLDPSWKSQYQWFWSVPMSAASPAGGRTEGVMQFAFAKPYEWLPREQEMLFGAAERCLMAAEKARLVENLAAREEQVRELAEHMLQVEERERRRISRELHDEAGQSLLCMRLQMEMLENSLPPERTEWLGRLREVRDLTEHTILEMRRLIAALSPAVLEQLGLGAALRQLTTRFRNVHPIQVKLHLTGLKRLPRGMEIVVYRLVQECFNNIAKHSKATAVNISVGSADGMVRLEVEDNGIGFRVEEALARQDSFGLSGMRERVALLGGKFHLSSHPIESASRRRRGTKITMLLPVAAASQEADPEESGTLKRTRHAAAGSKK